VASPDPAGDLTSVAESRQQRLHWLAEQILN
jgi:hypothetical protein